MRTKLTLLFAVLALFHSSIWGNNLTISNMYLRGQNDAEGYKMIKMDVRWDNSWRTSTYESNHDAVWIFAKYRQLWQEGVWNHATINVTGHTVPAGATVSVPADSKGAFIYRNADGVGSVNFTDLQLRWNYTADGLNNTDSVEICVFGIEMVYIPQGNFFLGDGNGASVGQFIQGTTTNTPFEVTSENEIELSNTSTSHLWATSVTGAAGTLPAAYPKGYQAFYVMKYEITQGQYRDFLNKLTRTQQGNRNLGITVVKRYAANSLSPNNRNSIRLATDLGGTLPYIFDCDLNNNDVGNEADDGEHIACNHLSAYDILAYCDWSGLRPITELEYEKACRGTLNPYPNEKAWGNTNIIAAVSIQSSGLNNEYPTNPTITNVNYGNAAAVQGPLRAGSFAGAATTREQAGATYYGVMEMSGNCWEFMVGISRATERSFNGSHGDGVLSATGEYNQANWPNRLGFRGGAWISNTTNLISVSDRTNAGADYYTQRANSTGGRGVRTAP